MFIIARFKISGHSMIPAYNPGDLVVAIKFSKIKKGDVVVFKHNLKYLIKRVTKVSGSYYFVAGDNKKDSLDAGKISKHDIMGKVLFKL